MKRLDSLFKVVAMMVIVSLCASLVTACDGQKDDRTDFTTRETEVQTKSTIDEPNQTINTVDPDKTEPVGTTESSVAQTGKYTYTVYAGTEYETTLSMDVNIDDYILNVEGEKSPFFSVGLLWEALGYQSHGKGSSFLYASYAYSDAQMVWRYGDCYGNKDNSVGYVQLCSFMYHKAPLDNYEASANPGYSNNHSDYGIYVTFSQHPDDLCYYTFFPGSAVAISRDDAIVITYVLSSAISRPGENPFAGTNLEKAQSTNSEDYLSYLLP